MAGKIDGGDVKVLSESLGDVVPGLATLGKAVDQDEVFPIRVAERARTKPSRSVRALVTRFHRP